MNCCLGVIGSVSAEWTRGTDSNRSGLQEPVLPERLAVHGHDAPGGVELWPFAALNCFVHGALERADEQRQGHGHIRVNGDPLGLDRELAPALGLLQARSARPAVV